MMSTLVVTMMTGRVQDDEGDCGDDDDDDD
jgi:hypothetical protein